jgi:hypothetical protein
LLVQKFLVASVHFYVPNFLSMQTQQNCRRSADRRGTIVSSLISGRKINTISTGLRRPSAC